jgi:hypothetical protein
LFSLLGAILIGLGIIVFSHYLMDKPLKLISYLSILLVAIIARSIGKSGYFDETLFSSSFWVFFIAILFRQFGLILDKDVLNGEYFVKMGISLFAIDLTIFSKITGPSLVIAWCDTIIVLILGILISRKYTGFSLKDSIIISSGASIGNLFL